MKWTTVLIMALITFCWIWLLPFMLLGFFLSIPVFVLTLPICILISLTLQWFWHDKIIVDHFLRQSLSQMKWSTWFPCNTIQIKETSIIACHPHGLLCCGALAGIHLVPGATTVFCVAPILFYVPVLGWVIRALGCIPAEYSIMLSALHNGYSVIVVPGGVPELVMAESRNDKKWFRRGGFLRLAVQSRAPLQMVFVQGECSTYTMIEAPLLEKRTWLSWKFNVPLVFPVFWGWYGTWLPKRQPLILKNRLAESRTKGEYYEELLQFISE